MARGISSSSSICIYICVIAFTSNIEARPNNFFDFIANRTTEIYASVANRTTEIYASVANETVETYDSLANRTAEIYESAAKGAPEIYGFVANRTTEIYTTVSNETAKIYDSVANRTQTVFVDSIYDPIVNYTINIRDNILGDNGTNIEKIEDCSIVFGGALAGALIGPFAVGLGLLLVLCLVGFTCCGVMAGSAAACCQSSIGDVSAGSCFSCFQSIGAGGYAYFVIVLVIGIPLGLGLGGYIAETYVHCFS